MADSVSKNYLKSNRLFAVCAAFLFCAFAVQLVFHAVRTSATVDEGAHILAGHRHLQCGDFGINPEHPPMLKMLAAVPLEFMTLEEPAFECGSRLTTKPEMFADGTSFVVRNGIDRVVVSTRLAASLPSLFLAILVFAAAWAMFGRWEGLTALALIAFEPSLIAHGSLVTTDMAITATVFAAVFAVYSWRERQTWFRLLVAGLAFGLMLAAKHSAVVFLPIILAVLAADVLFFSAEKNNLPRRVALQIGAFGLMFLIGFTVLWAFYGFRYAAIPNASAETISIAGYIKENGRPEMVETFSAKMTDKINRAHLFPESYVLGMADVIAWGSRNSFAFGKSYPTGQWWYFPLAFAVKSSVALLLLLPLGLAFPFFNAEKRREMLFILAPPLLFFGFAMTSAMTIGVRHILPVYGFFIVAAAVGAVWTARKFAAFKYVLIALLVFHGLTSAFRVAPHYLVFANDFWGGTNNTWRIFRDSNTDTGQDLKTVNEYLKRENINDCWFTAFNHRELVEASQPCRVLPSALRILVSQTLIEPVPPVVEGTVLVSVNELPPRGAGEYAPFTKGEPVAFLGGNILVYRGHFEIPVAAAMSRAYRSGQFLRLNQIDEALTEARLAVELAPEDARTQLAFGLALLRAGQKPEARRAFEKVVELAPASPVYRNAEVRALLELEKSGSN